VLEVGERELRGAHQRQQRIRDLVERAAREASEDGERPLVRPRVGVPVIAL
jgi:hypothetical protein